MHTFTEKLVSRFCTSTQITFEYDLKYYFGLVLEFGFFPVFLFLLAFGGNEGLWVFVIFIDVALLL